MLPRPYIVLGGERWAFCTVCVVCVVVEVELVCPVVLVVSQPHRSNTNANRAIINFMAPNCRTRPDPWRAEALVVEAVAAATTPILVGFDPATIACGSSVLRHKLSINARLALSVSGPKPPTNGKFYRRFHFSQRLVSRVEQLVGRRSPAGDKLALLR